MVMLTLPETFVNLLSTGQAVAGLPRQDRDESYSMSGDVRTYAGGRRRSITTAGEAGTYRFTLLNVARADIETLRSWLGQLVEVRDSKGRQFYGVFFGVTPIEVYSYASVNLPSCPGGQWHVTLEVIAVTTEVS